MDLYLNQQTDCGVDGLPSNEGVPVKPVTGAPACKICGSRVKMAFSLPRTKLSGHPIPEEESDCPYFECETCRFLFCELHDHDDNSEIYDEGYWDKQDPDWGGRVNQTLRLVLMANTLLNASPWKLKILDFGCGMGTFVESVRNNLQMQAWGTDIIKTQVWRGMVHAGPPIGVRCGREL